MYKILSFIIIAEYCATTESSYVNSVSSEFIAPHEYNIYLLTHYLYTRTSRVSLNMS